ncbi:Kunitz trypsin inhibitor [Quillaja saponaria]|uniref:Kunitz trypsin inhibitor n=1 Tax=Quillaja saponaria TaxID=32244 RepID=A0AAD7Q5U2_QUISA|nr:Kunitz trypsin inhibitor [Quillaja saponaria]KAJ7975417.1 Kunitz trypsin inhibitor [Quillaja saponaria]KAJ7975420.1 Kunitz trypsin inhibitor [Quillaja saponaria]
MKTSFLAALTTFLLFALITTKPSVVEADMVFDTDGNPVEWLRDYYILPFTGGPLGGGLTLGSRNNRSCPLYVIQEHSDFLPKGLTVSFSPKTSRLLFVTPNDRLSITTTTPTIPTCELLLVWQLVPESNSLWLVSIGGSSASLYSVFKIVPYKSYSYNILFCTRSPVFPSPCKGLGIYYGKDGTIYLALGDNIEPFPFMFQKADEANSENPRYLETV